MHAVSTKENEELANESSKAQSIRDSLGLVHIYTGDGKGKTTAALGLALRALEHELTVSMVQFLKGGQYIGELLAPRHHENFSIEQFGKGSVDEPQYEDFAPDDRDRARALVALKRIYEIYKENATDVLILDEVNVAAQLSHLHSAELIELIENKPKNMELVLTGRNVPKEILEHAHYVTEMKPHKHPFQKGIMARKGIDY